MLKTYKLLFIIFLLGLFGACETCNNCGPVMDNPYLTIEFYSKETKRVVTVRLDQINDVPSSELSQNLQRRGTSFRLPLAPASDISNYDLAFTEFSTDIEDTVSYERQLRLSYHRTDIESNGTVYIKADQLNVIYHDFDSISPSTFDQSKLSNELKLSLYL